MQLTRTSEKLNRTILFNAERREISFTPPADSGYFSLILIRSGEGNLTVSSQTGEILTYTVTDDNPMALCLRNGETMTCSMTNGDILSYYDFIKEARVERA